MQSMHKGMVEMHVTISSMVDQHNLSTAAMASSSLEPSSLVKTDEEDEVSPDASPVLLPKHRHKAVAMPLQDATAA
jgi:hypothetical protein